MSAGWADFKPVICPMLDVYFCCGQDFLGCPKLDDMVDFLQTLMARRETARQRLEEARKIVTAAESELRKWSDAVELEQRASGKSPASRTLPPSAPMAAP